MQQDRDFPYQPTRMGGYGYKYIFPVRCSRCGTEKDFESYKIMPDVFIHKKFMQWGWLLGRNRTHDVCPACLGITRENKLATKFKVVQNCEAVPAPAEVVQQELEKRQSLQKAVHDGLMKDRKYRELAQEMSEMKALMKELLEAFKGASAKKVATKKSVKKLKENPIVEQV